MPLKTVLKVSIPCEKCKKEVLQAVTSLEGVDKVEVDAEKGTLVVIGDVDPYDLVMITRTKAGKYAEFVTVGPPPKPEEKKPEEKKPECKCHSFPCPCPYPYSYPYSYSYPYPYQNSCPSPGFPSSSFLDCKPIMAMDCQYQDSSRCAFM